MKNKSVYTAPQVEFAECDIESGIAVSNGGLTAEGYDSIIIEEDYGW